MSLKNAEREGALILDSERLRRSPWRTQLWVSSIVGGETIDLKVDLVNDTAPHVGDIEVDPVLGRTDNVRNILSNKIAAVFRYEPKDVADIWIISQNRSFSWREIIWMRSARRAASILSRSTTSCAPFPSGSLRASSGHPPSTWRPCSPTFRQSPMTSSMAG